MTTPSRSARTVTDLGQRICQAPIGQTCVNVITQGPITRRPAHSARIRAAQLEDRT